MPNKKFTPEQKIQAVIEHRCWKLTRRGGLRIQAANVASICRRYGIGRTHLDAWGKIFDQRAADAFAHGKLYTRIRALEEENSRLRGIIERLEDEKEWLKVPRAEEAPDRGSIY